MRLGNDDHGSVEDCENAVDDGTAAAIVSATDRTALARHNVVN